jgi:hypothetical protein
LALDCKPAETLCAAAPGSHGDPNDVLTAKHLYPTRVQKLGQVVRTEAKLLVKIEEFYRSVSNEHFNQRR